MSPQNHSVALAESQHHVIDPANPCRALDDGVEDRLHVRRRAADDAEHLGCRRLMLQRLVQFCVALLEFFEQAHVLDGDDRLIGEGFEERDLLFGKMAEPPFGEYESTPIGIPSRSNGVARTVRTTARLDSTSRLRDIPLRFRAQDVMDVNRLAIDHCSAGDETTDQTIEVRRDRESIHTALQAQNLSPSGR